MNSNAPVHVQFGLGPELVVVMSPVMPTWDEGQFFAPLTQSLVDKGYRVVIFDTLSLLTDNDEPFADFTQRWAEVLEPLGPIALIAGSALGGAVVQGLLATGVGRQAAQALLISSPTRADKILDRRLGAMADLASAGDVDTALMLLDQWVLPARAKPAARQPASAATADEQAGRRLNQGFRLLNELNVEPQVSAWPGRLLSIFGESSQLVRATNVSFQASAQHLAVGVPGAGMRPLLDDLARVRASVRSHLGIDLEAHA
ncbi:alpha/beta hydrolase [Pseudomonas chlororaphis]|uniref:Alpha/beta hydrolase n=1 Tax=Pseudomonas chlororaphis subsp. aurantiaca TaxID=86192 RepID=A0AAJ0ZPD6_9PSED|nr:alpha/beta hydrolase [Pseudomonas chlororaphis]MBU4636347.1 alpha/beta hydrolase [Pseudomonas chlororaphis subsp. aurantiaca]